MTDTRHADHPFIAIWEVTRACDMVCQHCRACAQPARDPGELTTAEGFHLLDQLADAHVPLVVLSGGDPAKREDLVELVAHGARRGLHMALTPSTTPLVDRPLLERLAAAGLERLAVSIDGATAAEHDAFRGVPGSFETALRLLRQARELGLRTQVNSSMHARNLGSLSALAQVVEDAGAVLWSVFYIVPVGRAAVGMMPSAEAVERSLLELHAIAERAPFAVKTTAAPHYRRVVLQAKKRARPGSGAVPVGVHGQQSLRVNDGRGFLFISHRGDIHPSGFLPAYCGNARLANPVDVYRDHPTFRRLREPDELEGKCGACEYRAVCGGSRARAWALEGNLMASDPLCAYEPPGWVPGPRSVRLPMMAEAH